MQSAVGEEKSNEQQSVPLCACVRQSVNNDNAHMDAATTTYDHVRDDGHASYAHVAPVPRACLSGDDDDDVACIMGIDEAGRGPVLGTTTRARPVLSCTRARARA